MSCWVHTQLGLSLYCCWCVLCNRVFGSGISASSGTYVAALYCVGASQCWSKTRSMVSSCMFYKCPYWRGHSRVQKAKRMLYCMDSPPICGVGDGKIVIKLMSCLSYACSNPPDSLSLLCFWRPCWQLTNCIGTAPLSQYERKLKPTQFLIHWKHKCILCWKLPSPSFFSCWDI